MQTASSTSSEAPPPGSQAWNHREVMANSIRLHYVEAGQGPPVVLLHGFPEFWYSWRRQLPALAEAGFRAVAPDLRGYNESDAPPKVEDYRATTLVEDIADLIRRTAGGQARVVGHDWGGVLAWRLAALHPELVRQLVILNAPHPASFLAELKRNVGQWWRSSYVLLFQLPWLPECIIRSGDFALLERAWRREPANPAAFSPRDITAYKQALSKPGRLTAPLHYYRAATRYAQDLRRPPHRVQAPTLVIWGCRDPFLSERLTHRLDGWVDDLRVERLAEASHWVQNDAADEVNRLLIKFFHHEPSPASTS